MARAFENNSSNPIKDLNIKVDTSECVIVEYAPSIVILEASSLYGDEKKYDSDFKHDLIVIDGQEDTVCIYPINTLTTHPDFLKKKYNQIESITLEGFSLLIPNTVDEVLELLEDIPSGFVKDYEYGLGLLKDYRFIIHAIEEIPEIKNLLISIKQETKIEGSTYILSYSDFNTIRKTINRITKRYQREGRIDKSIFTYNSLLNQLEPSRCPERKRPYKKDAIYKLVSGTSFSNTPISKADTDTIVNMLSVNKQEIYTNCRKGMIQLQEDIELLNLEWLIGETEKLISNNVSEGQWQVLLKDNPFILSLVFSYPVIKIQEQAFVGGRKITGSGDKITDFLMKNNLTNNAALVEIKKSSTPLLKTSEYRSGVYAPSTELSGSICQLLDQKYKFQKEISTIKDNYGVYDIESFSVDCVLLIGTIPEEKEKKKSFEIYRYNSKDVRIFTFDELLSKLKDIYLILKPKE